MKIVVFGTGAVGGYFGGKLAKAGENVTFIARSKNLEKIKENGLRIESYQGNFTIKNPNVTSDISVLKNADLILLCVKSYSTKEVANTIKPLIKEDATLISMQNGIDNENVLGEVLGSEKILGSVLYIASSVKEPGIIKHTSYGKILFGELDGKITDRCKKIEKMFLNSGIIASVSKDIKADLWTKLMFNVAFNGFTSTIGTDLKKFHDFPEAKESFKEAMKEVQLVARKEGISITDEAFDKMMSYMDNENVLSFKSSTLQDAEARKPLEIEAIQGTVIKLAQKHNVDIPANRLLYSLLKLKY